DGLGARRFGELVVQDSMPAQVGLVAPEALTALLLLDPCEVDVRAGVVRRGMRCSAVGDGLDERRARARPGAAGRVSRRVEDGEHVAAVDPYARNAVADSLVRKSLGG